MSDRLNDLRRERAVIQAHLEWLDREIAALADPTAPPAALARTGPTPPPLGDSSLAETTPPEIAAALAAYRQDPAALQSDVRKGCFLYFGIAILLLVLGVTAFYLYSRNLHADRGAPATTPAMEESRTR